MAFEAHGEAVVYWQGKVLVVEPSGSINEEASVSFSQSVIALIAQTDGEPWCRLEHIKEFDVLGTPGASEDFRKTLRYCKQNGCLKMSWVGGNSVLRQQFRQICGEVGMPCEEYPDFDTAISALAEILAP